MRTTLSTKGQLVIPKDIRARHGWTPGTVLVIEEHSDHLVVRAVRDVPATTLEDVVGCTGYRGPRRTLEDMEAGIARGARRSG